MTLEVRYVPMIDEGDEGKPKIMRTIYNEQGVALSYSEVSSLKEAQVAQPTCIGEYFDLVKDYFVEVGNYFDAQTTISSDVYNKMLSVATMCFSYVEKNPIDYEDENN